MSGPDAIGALLTEAEPLEVGQRALVSSGRRSLPEPERTVNVHLEGRGAFEAFNDAAPVDLHLNTAAFWWPDPDLPEELRGANGMSFAPPPESEEDGADQGDLFGREEDPWEKHWRGMPAFEQEDRRPWKTIEVRFLSDEGVERFEREMLDGRSVYHGKWTWYPFQEYQTWSDKVWALGTEYPALPRYPVYVISKGRADQQLTSNALDRMNVPHRVVVEPQEADAYRAELNEETAELLVLPFSDLGQGSIPARNWVWAHSAEEEDADRHWILDDNLDGFYRLHQNAKRLVLCPSIFSAAEDFVDRYQRVGIAGFQYESFAMRRKPMPPYQLNTRIYSCILLSNDLPFWWRGRHNEDTDLSLRALKGGWRTVLFNAFLANKVATQRMSGGNTDTVYAEDEVRHEFADSLRERHPDLVDVTKKWGRWHHDVDYSPFAGNELQLREDADPGALPEVSEYGMELTDKSELDEERTG